MTHNSDQRISVEAIVQTLEHGIRKIERYAMSSRIDERDERHQAAIPAAEIEHPAYRPAKTLEERFFAFSPVGNRVGLLQVRERMFWQSPQVCVSRVLTGHRAMTISGPG